MPETKLKPRPFCGCDLSEFPEVMIVHRDYTDDYIAWKHGNGNFIGSNDTEFTVKDAVQEGNQLLPKKKLF